MKEIYDWVPWFEELANKIADGGERYLAEKAKQVAWKGDSNKSALLRYGDENIDPFSFFYTLASNNGSDNSRSRVYSSIEKIFDLNCRLDVRKSILIPTPMSLNLLFHGYDDGNSKLLWRLYRQAVLGFDAIDPDDFENALKIHRVATTKLTQALFGPTPIM